MCGYCFRFFSQPLYSKLDRMSGLVKNVSKNIVAHDSDGDVLIHQAVSKKRQVFLVARGTVQCDKLSDKFRKSWSINQFNRLIGRKFLGWKAKSRRNWVLSNVNLVAFDFFFTKPALFWKTARSGPFLAHLVKVISTNQIKASNRALWGIFVYNVLKSQVPKSIASSLLTSFMW